MFSLKLRPSQNISTIFKSQIKDLWGYVAIAFNKVDDNRLRLVGPDRLCAEWVLKNGGAVSFTLFPDKYVKDYNSLPPENIKIKISGIDGSDSSIMKIGFDHLINCNQIQRVVLHNCKHLEEDALDGLNHIKDTLKHLQVSGCYNLNDKSLYALESLTNLQTLKIFDLKYVKDLIHVTKYLEKCLTNCKITTE